MIGIGNSEMDEVGWGVFVGCEHWKCNPTSTEGGLPGAVGGERRGTRDGDACGRGVLLVTKQRSSLYTLRCLRPIDRLLVVQGGGLVIPWINPRRAYL
jgi:hypothetical protein